MKYSVFAVVLAVLGAAACQQKEAAAPAETASASAAAAATGGFEFTVQKNGLELAFKGVKGTQWKEAKHSCESLPCEFVLDGSGVNANRPVSGFGIAFTVGDEGVAMTSAAGASWTALNYTCAGEKCAFKVSDKGVAGI